MNKIGFGLLRLPVLPDTGAVDVPLLSRMADLFLENGGRYFDTAYTYLDGRSETALRDAVVKRYDRSRLTIADKLPSWKLCEEANCERIFREQCERCGVDFFDNYLLHWLNERNYAQAERCGAFSFLSRLKADGRARKIGFSYHDGAELLDRILTAHPEMDIVQLQINYLDWHSAALDAEGCYKTAVKHGKEIIVMEPVKGGTLAKLPAEGEALLHSAREKESPARFALCFAQSLPHVSVVLSGMNALEQVQENTRDFVPLNESERALADRIAGLLRSRVAIPCTGCRYCEKSCPQDIPIPGYFALWNEQALCPGEAWKMKHAYKALTQGHGKASDCLSCRACEQNCPQKLPISEWLKKIALSR